MGDTFLLKGSIMKYLKGWIYFFLIFLSYLAIILFQTDLNANLKSEKIFDWNNSKNEQLSWYGYRSIKGDTPFILILFFYYL